MLGRIRFRCARPLLAEQGISPERTASSMVERGIALNGATDGRRPALRCQPLRSDVSPGADAARTRSGIRSRLSRTFRRPGRLLMAPAAPSHFARVKVLTMLPQWVPLPQPTCRPGSSRLDGWFATTPTTCFPTCRSPTSCSSERAQRPSHATKKKTKSSRLGDRALRQAAFPARRSHGAPRPNATFVQGFLDGCGSTTDLDEASRAHRVLRGLLQYRQPRPAGPSGSPWSPMPLRADSGRARRHLRVHPRRRHPAAPPLRELRRSVERFISAAADDPQMLAIKMTLYRRRRQPVHRHADPRGRVRQAGRLPGRVEGPASTKRGTSCGRAAGKFRRPRGLRRRRPEDTHARPRSSSARRCRPAAPTRHIGTGNYHVRPRALHRRRPLHRDPAITPPTS